MRCCSAWVGNYQQSNVMWIGDGGSYDNMSENKRGKCDFDEEGNGITI